MRTKTNLTATELLRQRHEEIKTLFEKTEHADRTARSEAFDQLKAALTAHESSEEMCIHPLARSISDAADTVVLKRLEEEEAAKNQLKKLSAMSPTDDGWDSEFMQFKNAVLQHAEAEELELFPLIDANCSEAVRSELADAIVVSELLPPAT